MSSTVTRLPILRGGIGGSKKFQVTFPITSRGGGKLSYDGGRERFPYKPRLLVTCLHYFKPAFKRQLSGRHLLPGFGALFGGKALSCTSFRPKSCFTKKGTASVEKHFQVKRAVVGGGAVLSKSASIVSRALWSKPASVPFERNG